MQTYRECLKKVDSGVVHSYNQVRSSGGVNINLNLYEIYISYMLVIKKYKKTIYNKR